MNVTLCHQYGFFNTETLVAETPRWQQADPVKPAAFWPVPKRNRPAEGEGILMLILTPAELKSPILIVSMF